MLTWLRALLTLPTATHSPRFLTAFNQPDDSLHPEAEMISPGEWCLPGRTSGFDPLFQIESPGISQCLVTFRAEVRAERRMQATCLELLARFPGLAPRVARTLPRNLRPDSDWEFMEVTLHLGPGQAPALLRLGLATENPGTVWVRNAKVLVTPVA